MILLGLQLKSLSPENTVKMDNYGEILTVIRIYIGIGNQYHKVISDGYQNWSRVVSQRHSRSNDYIKIRGIVTHWSWKKSHKPLIRHCMTVFTNI